MRAIAILLIACILAGTSARAEDWPSPFGPAGNGVSTEASGWPANWPPARLWSAKVGVGCSSPIIAAGRLYVTGWTPEPGARLEDNPNGTDTIRCFDARSGEELWSQAYPCRYQGRFRTGDTAAYGGPSGSPVYDADTRCIYTLSTDGDLQCRDAEAEGRLIWGLNLYDDFGAGRRPEVGGGHRDFGYTGSPLIRGETIVVEVGSPKGLLMAFDRRTGERVAVSGIGDPAGHSAGPMPLSVSGVPCLATVGLRGVYITRADAERWGELVGMFPRTTDFACNIPSPGITEDGFVVTSGYNHKNMVRVRVGDEGFDTLWTASRHALVGTPLVDGDRIYTVGGSLACTAATTGEELWSGGRFEHGSCILTGDRKLIVLGAGTLALVDADPGATEYRELARTPDVLPGTCYPHPALADGILACKDRDGNLVCFDLAGPAGPAPNPTEPIFSWILGDGTAKLRLTGAARCDEDGALELGGGSAFVDAVPEALLQACRARNSLTLEAVIVADNIKQAGPARIVSFSTDPQSRNFTLGQQENKLVLRLRTTETGENGTNPETALFPIEAGVPVQVAVTYTPGTLRIYRDGELVGETDTVQGDFSNWTSHPFVLGNEATGDRDWSGRILQVAVYAGMLR